MGKTKKLNMKTFTIQTILVTLAYSSLTARGTFLQAEYAQLGEKCEGFNERTGKAFPSCDEGLICEHAGGVSIPGAGNICVPDPDYSERSVDLDIGACYEYYR